MISHEYRFIFVHAGRTGGSSLERMAGIGITGDERTKHLGNTDFLEKHKNFQYYRTKYPLEFVAYYKFTLVRNPFDRLVSAWLWRTTVVRDIPLMTLKDFIESRPAYTRFSEKFKLDGLTIRDSINQFDYIGRYEDFAGSLKFLQEKLNLPGVGIPHVNQTHTQGYQAFYDPETIAVVREKFGLDLELFGYDF